MTSKSSFFKLLKENLKQQLGMLVISFCTLVIPMAIVVLMEKGNMELTKISGEEKEFFCEMFGTENLWLILATFGLAALAAVMEFGYLHNKSRVDFYHGLPVSRKTLFAVRVVSGILVYLVPYLLMLLICMLESIPLLCATMFAEMFVGMLWNFLGYVLIFLAMAICIFLTGKKSFAVLLFMWLNGLVPLLYGICTEYACSYFSTYIRVNGGLDRYRFGSPMLMYPFHLLTKYNEFDGGWAEALLTDWKLWPEVLVVLTVYLLLAYFLFKNRSAEHSDSSWMMRFVRPVFFISVEAVAGVQGAFSVRETLMHSNGTVWEIIALVLAVCGMHALLQSGFYGDIRKALSQKRYIIGAGALALAFCGIFAFRWYDYDNRIPQRKNIERIGMNFEKQFLPEDAGFHGNVGNIEYVEYGNVIMQNANDTLCLLMEKCFEGAKRYRDCSAEEQAKLDAEGKTVTLLMLVEQKNGTKKSYSFTLCRSDIEEYVAKVFNSPERKEMYKSALRERFEELEGLNCVLSTDSEDEWWSYSATCNGYWKHEEKEEFLAALLKDIDGVTFSDITKNDLKIKTSVATAYGDYVLIFPAFTDAANYLKEHYFVDVNDPLATMLVSEMTVELSDAWEEAFYEDGEKVVYSQNGDELRSKETEDTRLKEQLFELLDEMESAQAEELLFELYNGGILVPESLWNRALSIGKVNTDGTGGGYRLRMKLQNEWSDQYYCKVNVTAEELAELLNQIAAVRTE